MSLAISTYQVLHVIMQMIPSIINYKITYFFQLKCEKITLGQQ